MTHIISGKLGAVQYHVGGRTAIGIQRCAEEYKHERFVQNRVGLHHGCLLVSEEPLCPGDDPNWDQNI